MLMGTNELLKLVREKNLVENLCEREAKNPEGTGFDLRLGEIYEIVGDSGFLGEKERKTPEVKKIAAYGTDGTYVLSPGEYVVVSTIEKFNLPRNIAVVFRPRSTLIRSGVTLYTAAASPGYRGQLQFGMVNNGPKPFEIELGARIVHALFFKTGKIHSAYRGQWQNGRVSTQGKVEEQV